MLPPDNETSADDGVDLGQLWGTIRESRRFILVFAAVLFAAVMAHALLTPMTFRTTGRLYLGELEATGRAAADIDISGSGQGDVSSEIEILKSKSLVARGILDAGLNVTLTPEGWRNPRFWQWLASDRDTRILDIAPKELQALDTSLADNSRGSQRYTVTFVSKDAYEVRTHEDQELLGAGRLGETLVLDGLTMALIQGSERGPLPGARYTMTVHPLDVVTDTVMEALTVASPKSVGAESAKVVNLEFTDRSPYFAATFLRKLMRGYLDERQAWKTEDASAAETFVTEQLATLRQELDRSEKKLADYRSSTKGVVLDNEAKVMIEQVSKYEEQRVAARLQVAALHEVKRALKLPNPPTEAFLLGEHNDTVLAGLSKSLADARQMLDDAVEQFGGSSPQARQQRAQVDVQLQMIRNYVANRLSRAEENLSELNRIIGQFEEKLRTVPGAELGLAQLGRESEVYSRVYSYLLERQQQAAITKASTVSKNRILDFPQVPYREDAPKLLLRLASAPLALVLGAVLVLLHRMFASSLQSESEVRRGLFGLPIFATVPRRSRLKDRRSAVAGASSIDVLAHRADSAPFAEAFRTLRTNLYHYGLNSQGHVALFTSPSPGDGKTTCVLSLAAILAADKKRVLVVDADLRKPSHHDLTDTTQGPGLRGILSGQTHWIDVVQPVRLSVGVYDSIAAGKMAPAELLSSERMSRFLNDARAHYDFILLDSPSFPLVSDAMVLASVSDCVISVFRLRNTPRKLALEHVRGLSTAAAVYGAVVNDTSQAGSPYPSVAQVRVPARLRKRSWRRRLYGLAACLGVVGVGVLAFWSGREGALQSIRGRGLTDLGSAPDGDSTTTEMRPKPRPSISPHDVPPTPKSEPKASPAAPEVKKPEEPPPAPREPAEAPAEAPAAAKPEASDAPAPPTPSVAAPAGKPDAPPTKPPPAPAGAQPGATKVGAPPKPVPTWRPAAPAWKPAGEVQKGALSKVHVQAKPIMAAKPVQAKPAQPQTKPVQAKPSAAARLPQSFAIVRPSEQEAEPRAPSATPAQSSTPAPEPTAAVTTSAPAKESKSAAPAPTAAASTRPVAALLTLPPPPPPEPTQAARQPVPSSVPAAVVPSAPAQHPFTERPVALPGRAVVPPSQ